MLRALTLSHGTKTTRESPAPLAARPESFFDPCVYPSLRLHRCGRRSACVRLRLVEDWRPSCERSGDTMFDDSGGNAINGAEVLVAENENAQEICGEPSIRWSSQSGPCILFIYNTF